MREILHEEVQPHWSSESTFWNEALQVPALSQVLQIEGTAFETPEEALTEKGKLHIWKEIPGNRGSILFFQR